MESWIYQIACNRIIDSYRAHRETVELPADLQAESNLPEYDAETSLAGSLKETIDSLPEPYREALLLAEYQGLS